MTRSESLEVFYCKESDEVFGFEGIIISLILPKDPRKNIILIEEGHYKANGRYEIRGIAWEYLSEEKLNHDLKQNIIKILEKEKPACLEFGIPEIMLDPITSRYLKL